MCSNATKSVYRRQEQFWENLSLWELCRTAVRINGVTIFRAARCLDTQEHDVHFQKMLQRNLPLDGFEMLWGNVRISRCHNHIPDLGRRRSCSLSLRSVASFENALDLSAYGTFLHSLHYILAPFLAQFFPILGKFTLVAFWCSRAAGFYCFAGCMLHICALMWNTVKSV